MKYQKTLLALAALAGIAAYKLAPEKMPVYPKSDHYDPTTQLFENYQPQGAVKGVMGALWEMTANEKAMHPRQALLEVAPDWEAFSRQDGKSRFIWFGHSSLMMNVGGVRIATDPVFGDTVSPVGLMMHRFQPALISADTLPEPDLILISHDHYDHLEEPTIRRFARKNTHFIVPLGVEVRLQKWGISADRITTLDWWQSTEFKGIKITATPNRHDSGRSLFDKRRTLWAGFVLEANGEKIYYGGDSSWGAHFAQIAQRFNGFDLAFIENGQYNEKWPDNHMFPEQTAEAARILKTKRFVPIHWGAYPLALHPWNEPVLRAVPKVREYGIQVLTPKLGQVFELDSETEDWFR